MITGEDKKILERLIRESIVAYMEGGQKPEIKKEDLPDKFFDQKATFVTLVQNNRLRGCIGTIIPHTTMVDDLLNNGVRAAFFDRRFEPVTAEDLDSITIEISVLTPLEKIEYSDREDLEKKIIPGKDGIYIKQSQHSATFLPSVWDQLPGVSEFLGALLQKAGLSSWSDSIEVFRYRVESI